jgi:hypothetical protein
MKFENLKKNKLGCNNKTCNITAPTGLNYVNNKSYLVLRRSHMHEVDLNAINYRLKISTDERFDADFKYVS